MLDQDFISEYKISLEKRITRVEVQNTIIREDIKEVKLILKWILALIFGLNGSIIAILSKALM